jgi:hypothetical protein
VYPSISLSLFRYTTGSDNLKYEKSTRELSEILAAMIAEEKVEYVDGQYKLVKK